MTITTNVLLICAAACFGLATVSPFSRWRLEWLGFGFWALSQGVTS